HASGQLPEVATGRECARDPARAGRRRAARAPPTCPHAVEPDPVTVASLFIDALRFIPDNAALLLEKAWETAELAFTALGIAMVIAMPLGLWLGHRHRGLFLALGASSIGRALPSIALIRGFIAWLGVGFWHVTPPPGI